MKGKETGNEKSRGIIWRVFPMPQFLSAISAISAISAVNPGSRVSAKVDIESFR